MSDLAKQLIEKEKQKKTGRLDLGRCGLKRIPEELFEIKWLKELYFCDSFWDFKKRKWIYSANSGNSNIINIDKLPIGFNQLIQLNRLFFGKATLPKAWRMVDFSKLRDLQSLYRRNNYLCDISMMSKHNGLRYLDLSDNLITDISFLSKLTNLKYLNLSDNIIADINILENLTGLQYLDLRNNEIMDISVLSKLNNLQSSYLSGNQIKQLPKEITDLNIDIKWEEDERDSGIYLEGNPLESPPIEVIEKGRQAVIDYFKQIEEKDKDYIYEAKFIIVGDAGAGKTTLANKIMDPNYPLSERNPSTEGIDVFRWQFDMDNNQPFFMNIWDFGGQEIYHATHQFFLTKRSLYALVADERKENTDFFYWLDIVSLLSDNSPLLIIKNEKHDRMPDVNERQLRGQFTHLKEILPTNFATNKGLDAVVKKIKHYISNLDHVGTALPKTWVNVRKVLEKDDRNYISLDEFLNICEEHGFDEYRYKLQLSGYLHDLGVCLHFQDDPILRQRVILKPEWGTDAVYKVLGHKPVKKNLGWFTTKDLSDIWHEKQYQGMEYELLQLMIKFQLCYEIPGQKGHYIAPQLLTLYQPDFDWEESNNMYLRYTYEYMPKGIITRFIVVMHKWIHVQKYVWRSGVILSKENTKAEIIEYYPTRKITIRVSGHDKKNLMSIVMHELDKIHDSYYGLKYDKWVPCICSQCAGSKEPYFYIHKNLIIRRERQRREIECEKSYEMINVNSLLDDIPQTNDSFLKAPESLGQKKIFISYSHEDEIWKDRLMSHLNPLKNQGLLDIWVDRQISPGGKWDQEIQTAINTANISILLVSPNFLNSKFITQKEVPALLKNEEEQGLIIIPFIIIPCTWNHIPYLSQRNVLPKDGKALSKCENIDDILVDTVDRIVAISV